MSEKARNMSSWRGDGGAGREGGGVVTAGGPGVMYDARPSRCICMYRCIYKYIHLQILMYLYVCTHVCVHTLVRCNVLQCVAVCCCVLQCVAVCCSVLQFVAVFDMCVYHTWRTF